MRLYFHMEVLVVLVLLETTQFCVSAPLIANYSNLTIPPPKEPHQAQKVPLLPHLSIKPTTFFVKKDGFFLTDDKVAFWGVRARILEQYSMNPRTGRIASTRNVNCGYVDVDTSTDLRKYLITKSELPMPMFYFRMYLELKPDLDMHYELMMNVSLYIRHDDPQCRDVVGFNVSWNLEYTYSLFSVKHGYIVATSDQDTTYYKYLTDETFQIKYIQKVLPFPTDNDVLDTYDSSNAFLPRGWLCGRGLGNGTWIWECGPEEGNTI
eukprot:PhF_6_TR9722/c2_g1_i3/m.14966